MRKRWPVLAARIHGLLLSQRGQTLAEYGLIMSVIAVGVVLPTLILFREELAGAFNSATGCLNGGCAGP
jgi:Flp pilus assembly pilin Flp